MPYVAGILLTQPGCVQPLLKEVSCIRLSVKHMQICVGISIYSMHMQLVPGSKNQNTPAVSWLQVPLSSSLATTSQYLASQMCYPMPRLAAEVSSSVQNIK